MKLLFSIIVLALTIQVGTAQTKKQIQKAQEKVEELNQELVTIDPTLALTDAQKEKIQALHIQKLIDIQAITKSDEPDDVKEKQRKEIYKRTGKAITQEVLTDEQRKARMKAKKQED